MRVPRRRRAAGDLPAAGDRLGGDARVRRRGGVRDGRARARTRRSRWRSSRTSTPPSSAVEPLVAAGASATELMVAPTLIAAAWNMPGTPERWKELPPEAAALLVEFRGDERAASSTHRRAASARDPRRGRELARRRRGSRASAMRSRCSGTCARGCRGWSRRSAPPGVALIIEDVCVPPARVAEAAKDLQALLGRARLPAGRRRPRLGRQPALPADAQLRRAGGPRALRRLHGRARRADRRQVRRLAEGRARHRREHGARTSSASGARRRRR